MISIFRAGGIIFLSLLLAAAALAVVGIEFPETLNTMIDFASDFKTWILAHTGLEAKYNVWVKFLIQEQQFVFMFFVVIMRIVLLLILEGVPAFVRWLIRD